jgi:hypothetical protein
MSDAGGAGGREQGRGAGEKAGDDDGGAASVPASACATDDECDDGKACNGAEHCRDGQCEAGEAFSCAAETECFEDVAAAACRYSASERFAVYNGNDFGGTPGNAVAISVSRLAEPTRLSWSEGLLPASAGGEIVGTGPFFWSPDGKRLVFPTWVTDLGDSFEQKLYWLDLTKDIKGQARRLENVPVKMSSSYEVTAWSADFNALLLVDPPNEPSKGTTLAVRFNAAGAETANVPATGVSLLCDDDATVAYAAEDGTHIVSAWAAKGAETILPATLLSGSPDGRWLLLSDDAHGYLAPCKLGAKPEMLGGPAVVASGWSSDSKYLAYTDGDDGPAALSAWEVASKAVHHAIFEAVVSDSKLSFEPGNHRALYTEQTAKNEHVWHVEDLAHSPSNVTLPIPDESVDAAWVDTTGRIRYVDAGDLYVVAATTAAKPQLALHSEVASAGRRYSNDGTHLTWFETGAGLGALTQLYALDLAHDGAKPKALFHAAMTGEFSFLYDEPFLERVVGANGGRQLFIVPDDFASEPVQLNSGTFVDWPSLQPRR